MAPDDPNVVAIERDLERWFKAYLLHYQMSSTKHLESSAIAFADNALHDLRTKRVTMFQERNCNE